MVDRRYLTISFFLIVVILGAYVISIAQQSLSSIYNFVNTYSYEIKGIYTPFGYIFGDYLFYKVSGIYTPQHYEYVSTYIAELLIPYILSYGINPVYYVLSAPVTDVFIMYDAKPLIEYRVLALSGSFNRYPVVQYAIAIPRIVGGMGYNLLFPSVSCIFEYNCTIVDFKFNVLAEPNATWSIDELVYRLPIVYIFPVPVDNVTIIIENPDIVYQVVRSGTVGVAIDNVTLSTDLFDVYLVGDVIEIDIYTAPNSTYGFIYLYYGKGSSEYTEEIKTKETLGEETLFVAECRIVQSIATTTTSPLLPPPLLPLPEELPTETPTETPTLPVTTTPRIEKAVEIPWWLLLLLALIFGVGASRRRRV